MFSCEVSFVLLGCFFEEIVDQLIDGLLGNHGSDRNWVVLKDVDQALLDERFVDVVGLLKEELDPSGEVDLVLQEILDNLLHQDVG